MVMNNRPAGRQVDEMKLLVKGKLKEFGIPGIVSGVFTRNIPKLARWKIHS